MTSPGASPHVLPDDPTLLYAPPRDDDFPRLAQLVHEAFAGPVESCDAWMRAHTPAAIRVVREFPDAPPVASLVRIPMAQFFGGRSVPMVGIAGVAADPARRGRGWGKRLMAACVREMAAEGTPLSVLYASTRPFYRRVGYESAGSRFEYDIPLAALPTFPPELEVRRLTDADQPALAACYARVASTHNAMLDRGPYIWSRVWKFRDAPYTGFGALSPEGDILGYVMVHQRTNSADFGKHTVQLSDAIFTTPQAARTLVGLLANYATMGESLRFFAGPTHPIHTILPDHHAKVTLHEHWMLRVVNVPAALAARGYDPAITATLHLHVHDDVIPHNQGPWTLRVADSRATCERATDSAATPTLRLDVRALAALYTAHLTPHDALRAGLCQGDERALALARSIFAGPPPFMPDFF